MKRRSTIAVAPVPTETSLATIFCPGASVRSSTSTSRVRTVGPSSSLIEPIVKGASCGLTSGGLAPGFAAGARLAWMWNPRRRDQRATAAQRHRLQGVARASAHFAAISLQRKEDVAALASTALERRVVRRGRRTFCGIQRRLRGLPACSSTFLLMSNFDLPSNKQAYSFSLGKPNQRPCPAAATSSWSSMPCPEPAKKKADPVERCRGADARRGWSRRPGPDPRRAPR